MSPQGGSAANKRPGPICRYKQSQIRKPPPDVQEIENCACMRRVPHKGRCCLLNSADTEAPPRRPRCVQGTPVLFRRERGRKLSAVRTPPHLLISYQCSCFLLALTEMKEGNAARSSRSSQSKCSVFQRRLGGIGRPRACVLQFERITCSIWGRERESEKPTAKVAFCGNVERNQ